MVSLTSWLKRTIKKKKKDKVALLGSLVTRLERTQGFWKQFRGVGLGKQITQVRVGSLGVRGGLVFKAHRPLYLSPPGLRVMKKKKKKDAI